MGREIELKFGVPIEHRQSLSAALQARGARTMALVARYFDTPDGRLASHGLAWRLRSEGRRWRQAVKADGRRIGERFEDDVPARAAERPDPTLHGESARRRLEQALDGLPMQTLVECYRTEVRRLACRVRMPGGSLVEVAYDEGMIRGSGRSEPIAELEIELIEGSAREVIDLARVWVPNGIWLCTLSKAQRGLRLWRDAAFGDRPTRMPSIRRRANAAGLMRGVLQACLRDVLFHGSDIAQGRVDAEGVHRLRVGLRRLLTALRELQELIHGAFAHTEATLHATFERLGRRRDADAVPAAVHPLLERCGVSRPEWPSVPEGSELQAVRDTGFQLALLDLVALGFADDESFADWGGARTRRHVQRRIRRLHLRLQRAAEGFDGLDVEQRHRVRRQLKRLRILIDLTRQLWPQRRTRQWMKTADAAQDSLGDYMDLEIAVQVWSSAAETDPVARAAAACLRGHLAPRARRAARQLRRIAASPWPTV